MCEKPLISTEDNDDLTGILQKFIMLDPDQKTVFLKLHHGDSELRDATIEIVVRKRHGPCMAKVSCMPIQDQVKVLRIYETNAFQKSEGSGIYTIASRINHSCLPNVHHCWNNNIGQETVTTTREIKAGEEALTSYTNLCRTRGQRNDVLHRYGFSCTCPACDTSTPFGRASEKRREKLLNLDQTLAIHRGLPILGPLTSDRAAIRAAMELSEVLIEEGLENMELNRRHIPFPL